MEDVIRTAELSQANLHAATPVNANAHTIEGSGAMSPADFFLKVGDTEDALEAIIKRDDQPLDLTGYTVNFQMRRETLLTSKIDAPAVPDADQVTNKGKVRYEFADVDVDEAGTYLGEFKLTKAGKTSTYPNGENYIVIEIGEGVPDIQP